MLRFKVNYTHLRQYRVSRTFDTYEQAEEFIAVNALVYPLPGLLRPYLPTTGIDWWLLDVRA